MRTRDEVLREFEEPVSWVQRQRMADEIVRLTERLRELEAAPVVPVVTEGMEEAFMAAYAECEFQNGGVFTHRMGINAGITAALTAAERAPGA